MNANRPFHSTSGTDPLQTDLIPCPSHKALFFSNLAIATSAVFVPYQWTASRRQMFVAATPFRPGFR